MAKKWHLSRDFFFFLIVNCIKALPKLVSGSLSEAYYGIPKKIKENTGINSNGPNLWLHTVQ